MLFSIVTLFPELIREMTKFGVIGQAISKKKIKLNVFTPRSWATDIHKTIDDRPYGGGDGMVLMTEPLEQCLEEIIQKSSSQYSFTMEQEGSSQKAIEDVNGFIPRMIYLSPQGRTLDHRLVMELAKEQHLLLLCGRYAGVDQRLLNHYHFEEVSIGDYVISGGELGALVVIDAIGRQLKGVLGHSESSLEDSFAKEGLLEAPLFTRPRVWKDAVVPDFLLSGHHEQIVENRWLLGVLITYKKRIDLFESYISKQTVKQKTWMQCLERVDALPDEALISLGLDRQIIEDFKEILVRLKVIKSMA